MRRNGDPRWPALLAGDLAIYGMDVGTFRATVVDAIDGIVAAHPGDTVAVVAHAGVINAYLGAHLGIEDRLIWSTLDYASVTRVIANRDGVRTDRRPQRTSPLTAANRREPARGEHTVSSWILNDTPSKVFPLYSRANVGEVFPDPISPLNATTGFLANLEPGWRAAYVACQVWDHDIYDDAVEHNPLACFGGYLFINMSLMRLFGVRVPGFSPEAVDFQYFGDMPGIPSYESEARAVRRERGVERPGRRLAGRRGPRGDGPGVARRRAGRGPGARSPARPDLTALSAGAAGRPDLNSGTPCSSGCSRPTSRSASRPASASERWPRPARRWACPSCRSRWWRGSATSTPRPPRCRCGTSAGWSPARPA